MDLADHVLAALLPLLDACTSAHQRASAPPSSEQHERTQRILRLAAQLHDAVLDYWAASVLEPDPPAVDHHDDSDDIPF